MDTSLLELVKTGSPHHLLCHLKDHEDVDQHDLDDALHEAAWLGNANCLHILLAAGGNMYSVNPGGNSLLAEAVISNNPQVVRTLLEAGYDIDQDPSGAAVRALHLAVLMAENVDIVRILLKAGANVESRDADGDTPLTAGCHKVREDIVRQLIDAGSDVNAHGLEGWTALQRAVDKGSSSVVKLLLNRGAQADAKNENGDTAMHIACEKGEVTILEELLKHVDNVSIAAAQRNKVGRTWLHLAALSGNTAVFTLLTESGVESAEGRDLYGNTPLINACFMKHESLASALLVKAAGGMDVAVNTRGELGRTALHWATLNSLSALVLSLVHDYGGLLDVADEEGDSALHLAAKTQQWDLLAALMDAGSDVNQAGELGRTPLHWATVVNHTDSIRRLLAAGRIDVDVRDAEGRTALVLAALQHHYEAMEVLLEGGADVNVAARDGRTALHWVCEDGRVAMLQRLMPTVSDVNIQDASGDSALLLSSRNQRQDCVQVLLAAPGVDLTQADRVAACSSLHYLAMYGLTDCVTQLLAKDGAKVVSICGARDKEENTPLLLAAERGHSDVTRALVAVGNELCQVNARGKSRRTALYFSARQGLLDSVRILLAAGARCDVAGTEPSPLIQAARCGHQDVVRELLDNGADVNARDGDQRTALIWAAQGGHAGCVSLVLKHGANAKLKDDTDDTALTVAGWHGCDDVITLLLPHSEVDHQERDEGMSALHLAVAKSHADCVSALLAAGADVNVLDYRGNTALLSAAMLTSDSRVLSLVLRCGQSYDVNAVGDKGRAAIHWAVGDPDSVRELLLYEPDIDLLDSNGASPLLLAIAHGKPESAKYLIQAGCDINRVHQDGRSPLHHAAIYGDWQTTALLLEKGVDPDLPMVDERRPLVLAAIEGHREVVQCLVRGGSDVNFVYFDSFTALSVAASNRHYAVMDVLLEGGAKPDLIGRHKHRPLMNSILNDDVEGVIRLLRAGASLDEGLEDNKHPFQVAAVKNHRQIMKLLLSLECDTNALKKIIKEGAVAYFVEDESILRLLQMASKNPRSLQMLCRNQVLGCLHVPHASNTERLPVPRMIKDYLSMRELDKEEAVFRRRSRLYSGDDQGHLYCDGGITT